MQLTKTFNTDYIADYTQQYQIFRLDLIHLDDLCVCKIILIEIIIAPSKPMKYLQFTLTVNLIVNAIFDI